MKRLIERFKKLDSELNQLDKQTTVGYEGVSTTSEYDRILSEAQKCYQTLVNNGIDPFKV